MTAHHIVREPRIGEAKRAKGMEQFIESRISEPEKLIKADNCSTELGVGASREFAECAFVQGFIFHTTH